MIPLPSTHIPYMKFRILTDHKNNNNDKKISENEFLLVWIETLASDHQQNRERLLLSFLFVLLINSFLVHYNFGMLSSNYFGKKKNKNNNNKIIKLKNNLKRKYKPV